MQMLGAFLVLVISMLWVSRPHLREVWAAAMGRRRAAAGLAGGETAADSNEPMSYRTAVFGMAGATVILALLLQSAGLNFVLGLVVIVLFLVIAVALTRFVSEAGLLFVQAPFRPTDIAAAFVGTAALGAQNLTVLAYVERIFMFDLRAFLMPFLMDSWRLTEGARIVRRRLVPALLGGIAVAAAVSYISLLVLAYGHGAVTLEPWFAIWSPQQPFQVLRTQLEQPLAPKLGNVELIGVGAAVMSALVYLRARFPGWVFHPVGYAMGPSWPMIQLWFSILVGWLLKFLILRFGGSRLYRQARPLFLGMVLGEFSAAGLWIIIDSITGLQGHRFFLT
jgi:hypothetical protein